MPLCEPSSLQATGLRIVARSREHVDQRVIAASLSADSDRIASTGEAIPDTAKDTVPCSEHGDARRACGLTSPPVIGFSNGAAPEVFTKVRNGRVTGMICEKLSFVAAGALLEA